MSVVVPTAGTRDHRAIRRLSRGSKTILLNMAALFFMFPLFWLGYVSFMPKINIFRVPPVIFTEFTKTVQSFSWTSFSIAFDRWGVGMSFVNSIVITTSAILLTLIVCSLCAYAFTFMRFPGRNFLFVLMLATMMLPTVTMIAPYYRLLRIYGLLNNRLGLILPYAGSAFSVFLLRQYFVRLPYEIYEAAVVDGAGRFRIWWQLILPLSKPALAALSIYQFRGVWNDFLIPMIIMRSDSLHTFPIKLQVMDSNNINIPWDAMMATGFIAILVPVIVFLIFQRQFMEGISGALKG